MAEPKRGSIWKIAGDDTNFSVKLHGKVNAAERLSPGDEVVVYQSLTDGSIFVATKASFAEGLFSCIWPGPPYGE